MSKIEIFYSRKMATSFYVPEPLQAQIRPECVGTVDDFLRELNETQKSDKTKCILITYFISLIIIVAVYFFVDMKTLDQIRLYGAIAKGSIFVALLPTLIALYVNSASMKKRFLQIADSYKSRLVGYYDVQCLIDGDILVDQKYNSLTVQAFTLFPVQAGVNVHNQQINVVTQPYQNQYANQLYPNDLRQPLYGNGNR